MCFASVVTSALSRVQRSAAVTTVVCQTITSCVHATTAVRSRTTRKSSADFTSAPSKQKSVFACSPRVQS